MKSKLLTAAVIWIFASCDKSTAQVPIGKSIDSMLLNYPFIRTDLNRLVNDSIALVSFYEKLWELKTGKRDRVTIVHIGDSHIQADHLSGVVRQNLQLEFGNAGRGTVFPYRAAKSNEPTSYRSVASNGNWTGKRNLAINDSIPTGISGFTIATTDTNASVLLTVKDQGSLDYGFTRFTLFHSKGTGSYDIAVCDELNCRLGYFDAMKGDPMISVLEFQSPAHTVFLDCTPHDTSGKRLDIYGMLLENNQPGILYNSIGVNGAMYYHYNNSAYFLSQLAMLKPDLIIVSLGTNEAYVSRFNNDVFRTNMDSLISGLQNAMPDAQLLLTTPGDSFRRSRKGYLKNPNMQVARNTIISYGTEHNLACWDLYGVMGGYGSMSKWYVAGLGAKDRLHFSQTGYELQGALFYEAMMGRYEKYIIANHGK